MQTPLKKWLTLDVSGLDDLNARRKQLLNANLTAFILLMLVILVIMLASPVINWRNIFLTLVSITIFCGFWLGSFGKRFELAGALTLVVGTITLTAILWTLGSPLMPASGFYLYFISLGGLLFGRKGLILLSVASSALYLGLLLAQMNGLMPPPPTTANVAMWINISMIMVAIAYLVNYALDSSDQLIQKLQANLKARRQAQDTLTELNNNLEHIVAEQTADLEASNSALQHALDSRGSFMRAMTHELKTPLVGILGLAQALQNQNMGTITPAQRSAAAALLENGERLGAQVNQVLMYLRLLNQEETAHQLPINLRESLDGLVAKWSAKAAQAGVGLRQDLSALDGLIAHSDERRLRQVLECLFNLAVGITPTGGQLATAAYLQDGQVNIAIQSPALPLPAGQEESYFAPFGTDVLAKIASPLPVTGLDLPIARLQIELLGGSLVAHCDGAIGTTFYLGLPLEQAA